MSLFIGASMSGDAATNGLSFLFIALMIRYGIEDGPRLSVREMSLVYGLALLLALCRAPYFLVVLLFLIVPSRRVGSRVGYWSFFAILVASVAVINIVWLSAAATANLGEHGYAVVREGVSVHSQFRSILADPFHYVAVIVHTFLEKGFFIFISHFGVLGWLDTYFRPPFLYLYAAVLMFTAVVDGNETHLIKPFQRAMIGVIPLVLTGAIVTAVYAVVTPVGGPVVEGIQGRYFIACSPLFYLLLNNRAVVRRVRLWMGTDRESFARGFGALILSFASAFSVLTLLKLVVRYYVYFV